ncbi:hypothetical protein ACTMU2_09665 [Cupriavidus basilensis]
MRLELSEPGEQVRARYALEARPDAAGPRHIPGMHLANHGWSEAKLDQRAVAQFLSQCQQADREIDATVGALIDGAFELDIGKDGLFRAPLADAARRRPSRDRGGYPACGGRARRDSPDPAAGP